MAPLPDSPAQLQIRAAAADSYVVEDAAALGSFQDFRTSLTLWENKEESSILGLL